MCVWEKEDRTQVYGFWSALLLRRGHPSSAKKPQLLQWLSTLNCCLPLLKVKTLWSHLWRCWYWQCSCFTQFMENHAHCASTKFYRWWLDLEGGWRMKGCPNCLCVSCFPQTTTETWAGTKMFTPVFEFGANACGFLDLQDGTSYIFLFAPQELWCTSSKPAQPSSDAVMHFHLWNASMWTMNVPIFDSSVLGNTQDVPQLNYHLASVYLSCLDI